MNIATSIFIAKRWKGWCPKDRPHASQNRVPIAMGSMETYDK